MGLHQTLAMKHTFYRAYRHCNGMLPSDDQIFQAMAGTFEMFRVVPRENDSHERDA